MRGRERRARLARVAEVLLPKELPFYVRSDQIGADGRYQAPGWYWIPHKATDPEYLGFDSVLAEVTLRRLADEDWKTQNA